MSLFPDKMLGQKPELSLESIAGRLTYFHEQLHLIHWQTQSYAEHMATGGLYDYVHDFKDDVIEKLMGYTGRRIGVFKIDPISASSASIIVSELISFAADLKKFAEANNYLDIGNLADSLSGECAKCRYLLTLS